MKKVIILASVAALVVLASCKKSGTCTCTLLGMTQKTTYDKGSFGKKACEKAGDITAMSETTDGETETYDASILAIYNTQTCTWEK
jgi:2-phospho-L-lactate guanylyltransferase (CobY/MobA/RfbA family)